MKFFFRLGFSFQIFIMEMLWVFYNGKATSCYLKHIISYFYDIWFSAKDFNLAKDYQMIFFPRLFRFYLQALNIMETAIIFIGCYDNNYLIITILVGFALTVFLTTMTQNMAQSSVGKKMPRPFFDCLFFFYIQTLDL